MQQNNKDAPPQSLISDTAIDAHINAASVLVGLTIEAQYREGVKLNLRATANAARAVLQFPLDDEAEPAPVFRA